MIDNRTILSGSWSERWRVAVLKNVDDLYVQHGNAKNENNHQDGTANLRIVKLDVDAGRVTAILLDGASSSDESECTVTITMPEWTDEQWAEAVTLLSRQALFTAQLLAGEFPDELSAALQTHGLSLNPEPTERIEVSCTCRDESRDTAQCCVHVGRVLSDTAEMLDDDPWLLFLLRGRRRQQVLRMLRRARGQTAESSSEIGNGHMPIASRQAMQESETTADSLFVSSLEYEVESFWGSSRVQHQYRPHIVRPLSELILLRRLGPPAFTHANSEVYDTLEAIYRKVTDSAIALAYEEDPPVSPSNDETID